MNKSFIADKSLITNIINYYWSFKEENTNNNFLFKAKMPDCSLIIYSNGRVYFQGINAENEYLKWQENIADESHYFSHIGSDEVGCGDYLAPIVVCCCYVKKENINYLKEIGVKDSKMLSDETILKLAPLIKSKVNYAYFILTNKKYNEITNEYNMNKIKAYLHNFVIAQLVKKINYHGPIVIDKFCDENLYYNYLKSYSNDIVRNIIFECKAENKYIGVACGSILARNIFLNEIKKLNQQLNCTIPLGAGNNVDAFALEMLQKNGPSFLENYAKINFKNTSKIIKD